MSDLQLNETHDGEMSAQIEIRMMPMSLRTFDGELEYQEARKNGLSLPLELSPALKIWQYWRLIDNAYPYGVSFKTHHMLVPRRGDVSDRWHLKDEEKQEFEQILKDFVYENYDLWFENCPKRRSVTKMYHVHLAEYHDERSEMSL